VADVGDVDIEAEIAFRQLFNPNSIVEVAGGFAINGHHIKAAEIASDGNLFGGNRLACTLRLLDYFGGKAVREMMLADRDFDIDAEIVNVTEDLDNAPRGVRIAIRELENFNVNDNPVRYGCRTGSSDAVSLYFGRSFETLGDKDPIPDTVVLWLDIIAVGE
jgi:hypothetical protein